MVSCFFYKKPVVVPLNIILYNVFSGPGRGPEIYGTEAWHFYIRNLLLNFNIWFILAVAAFPLFAVKKLRFGILQNCKHCFCLPCIRRWRQQNVEQAMENKIVRWVRGWWLLSSQSIVFHSFFRSCPECRVHSDFIIPSSTWVEEQEDKEKLINVYRSGMKTKQCKYMKSGDVNECPFGNKCFYKVGGWSDISGGR